MSGRGTPHSAYDEAWLRYRVSIAREGKQPNDAAAKAEAVRVQRLRVDAQRPISVNLAEGIALSHKLMRFAGSARQH